VRHNHPINQSPKQAIMECVAGVKRGRESDSDSGEERDAKRATMKDRLNDNMDPPVETVGDGASAHFVLSPDQVRVRDRVQTGDNVHYAGPAGTGKTFVTRLLVKEAVEKYGGPAVLQSSYTATAVLNMSADAATLHSLFYLGTNRTAEASVSAMQKYGHPDILINARILFIDEVSTLSMRNFEAIEKICRLLRKSKAPFGGLQVVVIGDFLQLPPMPDKGGAVHYAFESPLFNDTFGEPIILTKVFRQQEGEFLQILTRLRVGKATPADLKRLNEKCYMKRGAPKHAHSMMLHTHRNSVKDTNERMLGQLPKDAVSVTFTSADTGRIEGNFELLDQAPAKLSLKVGARVVYTKNLKAPGDSTRVLRANGATGVVVSLTATTAGVLFDTDAEPTTVGVVRFRTTSGRRETASRTQLPLALGWATTIHKSQGMTLDAAHLSVNGAFASGHVYTAASRVRDWDDMSFAAPLTQKAASVVSRLAVNYYYPPAAVKKAEQDARDALAALESIEEFVCE
jgi:ATP-dependent DNA helicase PIF1